MILNLVTQLKNDPFPVSNVLNPCAPRNDKVAGI